MLNPAAAEDGFRADNADRGAIRMNKAYIINSLNIEDRGIYPFIVSVCYRRWHKKRHGKEGRHGIFPYCYHSFVAFCNRLVCVIHLQFAHKDQPQHKLESYAPDLCC